MDIRYHVQWVGLRWPGEGEQWVTGIPYGNLEAAQREAGQGHWKDQYRRIVALDWDTPDGRPEFSIIEEFGTQRRTPDTEGE